MRPSTVVREMGRHPPLERATLVGSSPRAAVACVGLVLGLQGCTRRLQLFQLADDATASIDVDTGVEPDPGAKPGLERRLCIAGTTEDFRLPSARWGLSVAFASRKLGEPAGNQLRLRPEWFLASAWQSDYFGCGGYGTPWSADPSGTEGGCFALQSGTHWLEISRLFPETFELDAWPSMVDGDHPEASALALAHAVYAGHLLLRRIDDVDPDAWLASSADPLAATRLATLFHAEGPWSVSAAAAV